MQQHVFNDGEQEAGGFMYSKNSSSSSIRSLRTSQPLPYLRICRSMFAVPCCVGFFFSAGEIWLTER